MRSLDGFHSWSYYTILPVTCREDFMIGFESSVWVPNISSTATVWQDGSFVQNFGKFFIQNFDFSFQKIFPFFNFLILKNYVWLSYFLVSRRQKSLLLLIFFILQTLNHTGSIKSFHWFVKKSSTKIKF